MGVDVNMVENEKIEVAKRGRVAEQLARFTDPDNPIAISPTALYRYIACPLRFYFYSLARIRDNEELDEGVDAPMFGTILHAAVQNLYEPLKGIGDFAPHLHKLIEDGSLESFVDKAINENYLQNRSARSDEYAGNILLVKEIVIKYIRDGIVAYDLANPNFMIENVEHEIEHDFALNKDKRVRFKGIIDRLDRMANGSQRIVDYKSGSAHLDFRGVESLFKGDGKARMSNIIQTLLYSMMLSRGKSGSQLQVTPSLYYVRSINKDGYSPLLVDCSQKERCEVVSYSDYSDEFEGLIHSTLTELLDPKVPFYQCEDSKNSCPHCDYRSICKR